MAKTGRYSYCPAAGKIHRNRRTLREWLLLKLRRRDVPDQYGICDFYPVIYPSGYKK